MPQGNDLNALIELVAQMSNHELVFNVTKATLAEIEMLSASKDANELAHQEARLAVLKEEAERRSNTDLYRRGVDAACKTEGYAFSQSNYTAATQTGSYQNVYDGDPLLDTMPGEGDRFLSDFLSSRPVED